MTGDATVSQSLLVPHAENAAKCPEGGCGVGNRPVIVAGGTLDIKGLPEACPTWKKLKNVVTVGPPPDAVIETYIPPPVKTGGTTTGDEVCSDILVETDFESANNQWYKNYGVTSSFATEDADGVINHFGLFQGRTSTWNGPQMNFDPYCIVPNVEYFVSARAKLIGITEETCLQLTSYFYDEGASPEKRWNVRGQVCTDKNDEWFEFLSVFRFDERAANPTDPSAFSRRLYWEKPPAGVDIALDDIKIFRKPSSSFPDLSGGSSDVCNELFINGDAQDTSIHPFTSPFRRRSGGSSVLKIESEESLFDTISTNYFYAMRNRQYSWDTPGYYLLTDCIQKDSVYSVSLDIRVHSESKKNFRVQLTVKQEDGSDSWPWLFSCPPQDFQDGWVTCSGEYTFDEMAGSASKIELYLVSDDSHDDDIDVDNYSMTFKSGPVTGLVVPDSTGDLASCWGEGSEILVTSPGLNFDGVDTPTIKSVTFNGDGTSTLELAEPIGSTSFSDNEPDYAVEVALLSRNIVFESDSSDDDKGGHLMVFKTPGVAQTIQGISLRKFGQQGNLGRYPLHFHLSGSVEGSIVAKNVVRESNQRCYVIHGTHNVTLDSNIAYSTKGHCFMLEDGGEMDNTFIGNLAAVTRKVDTKIRDEETDNTPSSFWLTNPMNTFIGNVAAGSEHSGFWFEMRTSVRNPTRAMSAELSSMNPSVLPLKSFKDNVAHSNYEHGVKTYPGSGLEPEGDPAIFQNTQSFRNKGSGVFIHNSRNIVIEGGIFADNRVQIDVDRSPTCSILDATIIGYSPEYRTLAESANLHLPRHCPSGWPIRGVELHTFWSGGDKNSGTTVDATSFSHFGDSGCTGSTALRIDPENKGYFDVRTSLSSLSFDPGTDPLSSCDAISVDNVAIQDIDGSIIGQPGYIVSDNSRMTAFAPNCTSHASSCTAHCPGVCFRTMGLAVSTFEDDSVLLEITDTDTQVKTSFLGEYDWPHAEDGSINMAEHTKTHRSRRFFATLPSEGNYTARFVKDGQTHWPLFVKQQYEDPGHNCPDFQSFTVVVPEVAPGYCDELIRNGDVSSGVENWWATMGGVVTIDESASGQGMAITNEYRTAFWMGPAQFLDSRCMTVGNSYKISAKVKLINKTTGTQMNCNAQDDACPKLTMKYESGAWEDINEGWQGMTARYSHWDSTSEWNTIEGEITISQQVADAGSVLMYSECGVLDALMVFDDVSIHRI